jgi:hypothetical protein
MIRMPVLALVDAAYSPVDMRSGPGDQAEAEAPLCATRPTKGRSVILSARSARFAYLGEGPDRQLCASVGWTPDFAVTRDDEYGAEGYEPAVRSRRKHRQQDQPCAGPSPVRRNDARAEPPRCSDGENPDGDYGRQVCEVWQ